MKYTPTSNLPEGFEAWWKVYPRKVGKGMALRAWLKNDCEAMSADIIKATKKYPFSDDQQYVPHGSTWINSWRFFDEFEGDGNDSDW